MKGLSGLSRHDQKMLAVTVAVIAFGVLGAFAKGQMQKIRDRRDSIRNLSVLREEQKRMVSEAPLWSAEYGAVRHLMPVFPPGEQVRDTLRRTLVEAANRHGIEITQHDSPKDEIPFAGAFELPIGVRKWEGTLSALLDFVYDLENNGAMMEFRDLRVQSEKGRQGILSGSFVIHSVYMRASDAAPVPVPTVAAPAPAPVPEDASEAV